MTLRLFSILCVLAAMVSMVRLVQSLQRGYHTEATAAMIQKAERASSGQFFIHMPPSGCPAGWEQIPDLFEKAGMKHDVA